MLLVATQLSLLDKIHENLEIQIFSALTDIFFLRRFLEKDYVTNGIAYTGAAHSVNYIYMLIKYFDFKITHYSYINIENQDLNNLHRQIKNSSTFRDVDIYFSLPYLSQCSDMTSFPKLFK